MAKVDFKLDSSISIGILRQKSKEELIQLILEKQDIQVPVEIFASKTPPLTALVGYLKDVKNLSVREISYRLNRHTQTIWTEYRIFQNKKVSFVNISKSKYSLPLMIFSKEKFSLLETIVAHLNQKCNLTLTQISLTLNKNVKTIWTCKSRYDLKGGKK